MTAKNFEVVPQDGHLLNRKLGEFNWKLEKSLETPRKFANLLGRFPNFLGHLQQPIVGMEDLQISLEDFQIS